MIPGWMADLVEEFASCWARGDKRPAAEEYVDGGRGPGADPCRPAAQLLALLLAAEARAAGAERPSPESYLGRLDAFRGGRLDDEVRETLRRELAAPAGENPPAPPPPPLSPGSCLGPYRILRRLGQGGMGTVFLVRQEDQLGREFALKVIGGADDRSRACFESLNRFLREAELTDRLRGVRGVVPIFTCAEQAGVFFYVMGVVNGVSLREHLSRGRPSPREAATLVEQAARVMGAVHDAGVVHRDLKPENLILPCGGDVVHVVDFGLAAPVAPEGLAGPAQAPPGRAEADRLTATGQFVGTWLYAAPERFGGRAGDRPPADVFALGAVLWELLTGRWGDEERQRAVEGRLDAQALRRLGVPPRLAGACVRALHPDPRHRFPDAEFLANALRFLLEGQGCWEGESPDAAAACEYRGAGGQDLGLGEAEARRNLDAAASAVEQLRRQGKPAEALEVARRAVRLGCSRLGKDHPVAARSLFVLGTELYELGDYAWARPCLEQALSLHRRALGESDTGTADCLHNLGILLHAAGDYAAARPCLEQAVATYRAALGEDHPSTVNSLNNLGVLALAQGDYRAATVCLLLALTLRRRALGDDHADTAVSHLNLGCLAQALEMPARARRHVEAALNIYRKARGEADLATSHALHSMGDLLMAGGDLAGAHPYLERALVTRRRALGEGHPLTANVLHNLGALLLRAGDLRGAKRYLDEALAARRRALGDGHPDTARSRHCLGALLGRLGDPAAARSCLEQAVAAFRQTLGEAHPDTARALYSLGAALWAQGDPAGARSHFDQAKGIPAQAAPRPDKPSKLWAELSPALEKRLYSTADFDTLSFVRHGPVLHLRPESRRGADRAAVLRSALSERGHTAERLGNLGAALYLLGDSAEAQVCLEQALAVSRQALGDGHLETARALAGLGDLFWAERDYAQAWPCYEEAYSIRRRALGDAHPDTARSFNSLGAIFRERTPA